MCFGGGGGSSQPKEPSYPLPNGSQSPVWNNFATQQKTAQRAQAIGQGETPSAMSGLGQPMNSLGALGSTAPQS